MITAIILALYVLVHIVVIGCSMHNSRLSRKQGEES